VNAGTTIENRNTQIGEMHMATTKEHADFVKNMEKLDKILSSPKALAGTKALAATKGVDIGSYCKIYNQAKPILEAVLPIIEKIPVVGKIVAAVRVLMLLADSVCKL
jgi:activator of 2-hydroxyglutaryl-CoA dehydratase